jgi:dynein light chain LC8-type
MAERKAVIKNADMSEDMQQDAIDCASQALEKFNIEKDIAACTWHALVWRSGGGRFAAPVVYPQAAGGGRRVALTADALTGAPACGDARARSAHACVAVRQSAVCTPVGTAEWLGLRPCSRATMERAARRPVRSHARVLRRAHVCQRQACAPRHRAARSAA